MAAGSGGDTRGLLQEGIRAALGSWAVLQIAVDNGFGGAHSQEKAEWMVGAVEHYFCTNADLEEYEVEDLLSELMNNEFDTLVEDGSLPEMAQQVCAIYRQCQRGEVAAVQERIAQLRQKKQHLKVNAVQGRAPGQEEDDDEEESEDEEEEDEAMDCEASLAAGEEPAKSDAAAGEEPAKAGAAAGEEPAKAGAASTNMEDEGAAAEGWTVVRKKKK